MKRIIYDNAYEFAKQRHEGQTRKDGSPYITHPLKVAKIIEKYFSNHPRINELKTAAYLHDTIEDTNTTVEEIRQRYGEYVAYLVEGVTNNQKIKKIMGKTYYLCYKMLNMDEDVLNLKLCDRLANVLDLENAPDSFREKYSLETIIILNCLLTNKGMNSIQIEIIKEINDNINNLRKVKILKLISSNKIESL